MLCPQVAAGRRALLARLRAVHRPCVLSLPVLLGEVPPSVRSSEAVRVYLEASGAFLVNLFRGPFA